MFVVAAIVVAVVFAFADVTGHRILDQAFLHSGSENINVHQTVTFFFISHFIQELGVISMIIYTQYPSNGVLW